MVDILDRSGSYLFDGRPVDVSNISPASASKLYDIDLKYYESRVSLCEDLVIQLYLETEAKRSGVKIETIKQRLLDVSEPSESDIKRFYDTNKSRIARPYIEIKNQINSYLKQENEKQAMQKSAEAIGSSRTPSYCTRETQNTRAKIRKQQVFLGGGTPNLGSRS